MEIVNTYEAKFNLSSLLKRAAAGERIVIARDGTPVACLVPYETPIRLRPSGTLTGKIRIGDDFDAPLPAEIAEAFGAETP